MWQSASFSALSAQLRPVQLEDPCQTRGEGRDPHGVDEPRAAVPRQAMLPSARIHACHNDTFNFSMPASCTGTFSHGGTKHRLRAKYPIRAKTFRSRVYEYYDAAVSATARPVALEVQAH